MWALLNFVLIYMAEDDNLAFYLEGKPNKSMEDNDFFKTMSYLHFCVVLLAYYTFLSVL